MTRFALVFSVILNVVLLSALIYLFANTNPTVARVENSIGNVREVKASQVREQLVRRHGEDVLGDLAGREIVTLAAEESGIKLDVEELEARWHLLSNQPEVRASLDSGESTEDELRSRLVTLVLLDQLTLNELNPSEREAVIRSFFEANQRELEQIKLRHILVESEKEAEDVAQRLSAGVDFGQLAKRFSLDPLTRDQGGLLGWKTRGELNEDLSPLLFLMPPGRASRALSTRHGWHLFLVEERKSEYHQLRESARRKWTELRRPDTLAQLRERFEVDSPERNELIERLRPPTDPRAPSPEERQELTL